MSADYSISETITYNNITTAVTSNVDGTTTTQTVSGTTTTMYYSLDGTTVTSNNGSVTTSILNDQQASINDVALNIPQYPYGDTYFIEVVMRSYLDTLISNSTVVTLNNLDTYKYFGDFYGILNDLNIDPMYHPIILRMNGFSDPGLYDTKITSILMPNTSDIDQIAATYANTVPNPYG